MTTKRVARRRQLDRPRFDKRRLRSGQDAGEVEQRDSVTCRHEHFGWPETLELAIQYPGIVTDDLSRGKFAGCNVDIGQTKAPRSIAAARSICDQCDEIVVRFFVEHRRLDDRAWRDDPRHVAVDQPFRRAWI